MTTTFETEHQRQALQVVRAYLGDGWKEQLIDAWQTGGDYRLAQEIAFQGQHGWTFAGLSFDLRDLSAYLRQCRNRYGHKCLEWI